MDTQLMRKTLEHIEAHPEEWNQRTWGNKHPCGTSFCFAGHALNINGTKLIWDGTELFYAELDGVLCRIKVAARRILGISQHQADLLFYGTNNLMQIKDTLFHITNEEVGECTEDCTKMFIDYINALD